MTPEHTESVRRIAERAITFSERLYGSVTPAADAPDELGDERYRRWCERVAGGRPELLARRLAWDGLEPLQVRRVLGRLCVDDAPPQPWLSVFEEVLRETSIAGAGTGSGDRDPVPFEEVIRPFVRVARNRLEHRAGRDLRLLRPAARSELETALLRELSRMAGPALYAELGVFRSRSASWTTAGILPAVIASTRLYERFVLDLLRSGLLGFFGTYSMLARLLCTRVISWVERTSELVTRLRSDRAELTLRLSPGRTLGRVRGIRSDLSDAHRGWRTVCVLEFDGGAKVVYKPRSLAAEQAFGTLVDWLNRADSVPDLVSAWVVQRDGYGWMEYVESRGCRDLASVERFYERAGVLLCVIRLLGGGDLHQENLIARGDHPVLVDLEVLLGARIPVERELAGRESDGLPELVWDSVVRTMLLPCETIGPEGALHQGGALRTVAPLRVRRLSWRRANSDGMSLEPAMHEVEWSGNLPVLDGSSVPPDRHPGVIERGFTAMDRAIRAERATLLSPGGPLMRLRDLSVRVILRPTQVYASALARCMHPSRLRTGVEFGIELDVLSRARLARGEERPLLWPAFRHELAELERLDVPYFTALVGDTFLRGADGEPLVSYCALPPLEEAVVRLAQLDDADLERQLRFISISFRGAYADRELRSAVRVQAGSEVRDPVAIASSIAAAVDSLAFPTAAGRAWSGIVHHPDPRQTDLRDVGDGLYLGASGVAILHAALHAVTGDPRFRSAALSAVERLLTRLARPGSAEAWSLRAEGCGLGGIAGAAYALALCANLLGCRDLQEAARAAARMIAPSPGSSDPPLDLVSGSAGAVLALIAVHRSTGDRRLLDRAIAWAELLIPNRRDPARPWGDRPGTRRAGLGKGVAGVAHALLSLHRETGREELLDAAQRAWEPVRRMAGAEGVGWAGSGNVAGDPPSPAPMLGTWCLGASGIGLAAAASADRVSGLDRTVETALVGVRRARRPGLVDNYCCGRAGHIDFLQTAGTRLRRSELVEEAFALASEMLSALERRGSLDTGIGSAYAPGFFKGLAGIGYQLLRLHHPDRLPSVLLLQPPPTP